MIKFKRPLALECLFLVNAETAEAYNSQEDEVNKPPLLKVDLKPRLTLLTNFTLIEIHILNWEYKEKYHIHLSKVWTVNGMFHQYVLVHMTVDELHELINKHIDAGNKEEAKAI